MPANSSDPSPFILACDTTQGACSVALWRDGLLASQLHPMQKGHAEALMPMIETLCDDSGIEMGALDRLAVTHGPGTFTGVRVGLSAMRGLALALAIPVKTYGTLAVMAQACGDVLPLIVAVDAKRDTFFTQGFMADGTAHGDPQALSAVAVSALAVTLAATSETKDAAIALCGTGAPLLADALNAAGVRFAPVDAPPYPDAAMLAAMAAQDADWDNLPAAEPLYLRPPDATLPDPSKRIKWR